MSLYPARIRYIFTLSFLNETHKFKIMENINTTLEKDTKTNSFAVDQAVVGLEASDFDKYILNYLNFFADNISIKAASFIHARPIFMTLERGNREDFYHDEIELVNRQIKENIQAEIKKYLSEKDDTKILLELKDGKPLEVLLNSAETLDADLVVIGQKKGIKHHGILAKNFARKAKGNILIVPQKSKCKISTMLVPVDFSENSARALQAAISIRKQLKKPAKLIALNVFELPNFSTDRITKSFSNFKENVKAEVENKFEAFLEKYASEEKLNIEKQLLFKKSSNMGGYIYSFAADNKVDFMVMGAKGHSKLELLFMGSVTEKILSLNQTFPTLVIK